MPESATDSADQLNSFASQVQYYTYYIESRADWELVDIYADRGITVTDAHKRDEFLRMMEDCRKRKIDQILVKSLSRFARNTADCIAAIRELRQLGVTVIFEKERINTPSDGQRDAHQHDERLCAGRNPFLSPKTCAKASDADEFRQLPAFQSSIMVTTTMKTVACRFRMEEAKAIRWIYDRYLSGYGVNQIARELPCQLPAEARIHGSKIGILYILSNERYMGDELLRKSFTSDTVPFRKIMNRGTLR